VGRTRDGHIDFMTLIKKDRRYQLNKNYLFYTTVIPGNELMSGASGVLQLLKEGSSGPLVKQLQQALKNKGFDPGVLDGVFGLGTKDAVRKFQKANGLVADGIVGQKTWKALGLK
jgi:peptidoglycan hydrolase-like protein with peptidoglycan-binding domain